MQRTLTSLRKVKIENDTEVTELEASNPFVKFNLPLANHRVDIFDGWHDHEINLCNRIIFKSRRLMKLQIFDPIIEYRVSK